MRTAVGLAIAATTEPALLIIVAALHDASNSGQWQRKHLVVVLTMQGHGNFQEAAGRGSGEGQGGVQSKLARTVVSTAY